MIQAYLKDVLAPLFPKLTWSMDYRQAEDNTGTVYSEAGYAPDQYESGTRRPSYMVYIRSSDWGYVEHAAHGALKALHRQSDLTVTIENKDNEGNVIGTRRYHVFLITAASEPLRIGVENGVMEWSVNFDVTLKEEI